MNMVGKRCCIASSAIRARCCCQPGPESASSICAPAPAALRIAPSYDFDGAIRSAAGAGAQMLLALSGPGWQQHRARIAELAIQHRLPTMFIARHYVEAGGLI